jgi:CRP-like cAMP-binding protein
MPRDPIKQAFLADVLPFRELSDAERLRLAPEVHEIAAPPGHVFFNEGEASDEVFVARSGRIRIQHFRPDGSVRTVCMIGSGESFCCLPALDGGTYPATAVAAEESVVYRIPGPTYRQLLETQPAFARSALKHFCGRLREAGCEGCAQADDAGSRIAGKILTMADKFGDSVSMTRKELGELAGTTVETAIRVTREFEERGWLELGRGEFMIKDRAALERRARGPIPPPIRPRFASGSDKKPAR